MNPGGLIPPVPLKLSGNVWENWKNFKERFSIYMTAGNLHRNPEKVKVAIFLNLIGEEAYQLFKILKYPEEDGENGVTLSLIMSGYDNYFKMCKGSIEYNSVKFNQREQLEGETFQDFLLAVSHIAIVCKFDNIDRMLRDKIMSSVRDSKLRSRLLMLEDKSLDNVIDFCMEYEENEQKEEVTVAKDENVENFLQKKIYGRFGISVNDSPCIKDNSSSSSKPIISDKKISRAINNNQIRDMDAAGQQVYDFFSKPSCSKEQGAKNFNKKKSKLKSVKMGGGKLPRKFECQDCGKSYVKSESLELHRKLHTGEATYQCEICEKKYVREYNFKRHVESHTMEKLFSCNTCEKKFTYKNQLTLHVLQSHKA